MTRVICFLFLVYGICYLQSVHIKTTRNDDGFDFARTKRVMKRDRESRTILPIHVRVHVSEHSPKTRPRLCRENNRRTAARLCGRRVYVHSDERIRTERLCRDGSRSLKRYRRFYKTRFARRPRDCRRLNETCRTRRNAATIRAGAERTCRALRSASDDVTYKHRIA